MKKILSKIVSIALVFVLFPVVTGEASFTDVPETHPQFKEIEYLRSEGVIEGYSDNSFRPDQKINRVEALKIILLGSQVPVAQVFDNAGFADVPADSWFAKYVVAGKNAGIVKGNSDGSFTPSRTLNHAEALKITINTNNLNTKFTSFIKEDVYADVPSDEWFTKYFYYVQQNEIYSEKDSDFVFPNKEMTRGDLAELMYKIAKHKENTAEKTSYASYYGDQFQGRNTASGEKFDQEKLTAAHRTYPFGTQIRVTNIDNGESVIVTINDRGPNHPERIIDLSRSAFEAIAPLSRGVVPVALEKLGGNNLVEDDAIASPCEIPESRGVINTLAFDNISLDEKIPTLFTKNEVYLLKGQTNAVEKFVTVFLRDKDDKQFTYIAEVDGKDFEVPVLFHDVGRYEIGIVPGKQGVSKVYEVNVIFDCGRKAINEGSVNAPEDISLQFDNNKTRIQWKNRAQLHLVNISQGTNRVSILLNNFDNSFELPYSLFEDFSEGEFSVEIGAANSKTDFSIDRSMDWVFSEKETFQAIEHISKVHMREAIEVEEITSRFATGKKIVFKGKSLIELSPVAFMTKPNGQGEEVNLNINDNDVSFVYTPKSVGTHIFSIYSKGGEAIFIYPIYHDNGKFPLLPDVYDLRTEIETTDNSEDLSTLRESLLTLVNEERTVRDLNDLVFEQHLNALAQERAEDMKSRNYFSHFNLEGQDVNDLRDQYGINIFIAENIAQDANINQAHYGLMLSASHRANIVKPTHTQVGIGISKLDDGTIIVVELFTDQPFDTENTDNYEVGILQSINEQRVEAGVATVNSSSALQNIAQNWSEIMAQENITAGSTADGRTINELLASSGVNTSIITLFLGVNSIAEVYDFIETDNLFVESNWTISGVGIQQGGDGVVRVVILLGE